MPCSDGREPWSTPYNHSRNEQLIKENAELVERANLNARVACEALRALSGYIKVDTSTLSKELKKWWKEHKKQDERRLNAERMEAERQKEIAEAVATLTPRQRELLGIKYKGD
jgi:hypothetical protein